MCLRGRTRGRYADAQGRLCVRINANAMKISATIIAFNEERNIARVIESLRCCDEILVLDSGSNDRTVEIATKLGARVVEASWHGYAAQKNIAAELAANDWILSLDADESLSEALEAEIWQIKKSGPKVDGYTVPRLAQYLAAGFCIAAGIRTGRCGCSTGGKRDGWAISCTNR